MQNQEGTTVTSLLIWKDKVPMQELLDLAEASSGDSDKKMLTLGELNEFAYEDVVLHVAYKSHDKLRQG